MAHAYTVQSFDMVSGMCWINTGSVTSQDFIAQRFEILKNKIVSIEVNASFKQPMCS